ncbi:MAG: DNA double-strand break repair nuclease NurA [Anaerolineales bacterium]|nr:DNA double-strand break repair nuclease NurA [Anaerolineales bacterium]
MTLEFEKLTPDLENMALATAQRSKLREARIEESLQTIKQYAHDWDAIENALTAAAKRSDEKFYRSARPYDHDETLNTAVSPPFPPTAATIIATDGSQIMPDRHAAHLYYLINVGGIIYPHGSPTAPTVFSEPQIFYPQEDPGDDDFISDSGKVSVERDKEEIATLARKTWENRHGALPILSIVDQRLLYWPIGGSDFVDNAAVRAWCRSMTKIREADALLAGYIDRPGTRGVMTLLRSLTAVSEPNFNWKELGKSIATQGLADRDLFRILLEPGQRSKLFIYESQPNKFFAEIDPMNEVCFFYLNPGLAGDDIVRVDIPRWVAAVPETVTAVHALIIDQCRILGNYPYVLARADEMAVVGRQDASELNFMIDIVMQRHGISTTVTGKQDSKGLARGAKSRHEGVGH